MMKQSKLHICRKVVPFASVILVLIIAAVLLASCKGASAYEIAVKNGFEGSEEEWLESLVGKDGKDGKDGKNGVDGENGKDGEDGRNGISSGGDVSQAASVALRSAVSIFSNYKKNEYAGVGKEPVVTPYDEVGAGLIYSVDEKTGDAYIVTNYHVVYDKASNSKGGISEDIEIFLYGMQYEEMKIKATFIGGSMSYDVALLKVTGSDILKTANVCGSDIADSDSVSVGTLAIAIGNPDGNGLSLTSGVVNVDSEYIKMQSVDGNGTTEMRVMRIDAPLNRGNSGGGVYGPDGSAIGLVCAKLESDGVEGIGYVIPSNIVSAIADKIISEYEASGSGVLYKPTLGISVRTVEFHSEFDKESMKIEIVETVEISQVNTGTPAEGILKAGDRLVSLSCEGKTKNITRRFSAIDFILSVNPGETLVFEVERDGELLELSVPLDKKIFTSVK